MPAPLPVRAIALLLVVATPSLAQREPGRSRPTFSVAADLAADLSPDGPTLRDSARFTVRELELGAAGSLAGIDGAVLVRARDGDRISVHEAFIGGRLPLGFQARAGRFALPFGLVNEAHGHALPTVDAPLAHLRYLGDANVAATGVALARSLGRRVGLSVAAVDQLQADTSGLRALDLPNQYLSGLGYVGRLSAHGAAGTVGARLDLSGMTGRRLHPLSERASAGTLVVDAVVARQSVLGAELALGPAERAGRWAVVGQVLYQVNESEASVRPRIPLNPSTGGPFYEGPTRDVLGGSLTARLPLWRRLALVARGDRVEEPDFVGGTTTAIGALAEWRTAGGLQLSGGYESVRRPQHETLHRVLLRARAAAGERAPWPF